MDRKTLRRYLIIATVSVLLFACVTNLSNVFSALKSFLRLLLPITAGGIIALFASIPINGYKQFLKKLFSKTKLKSNNKVIHFLSFILTFVTVALILVLVLTLLIPELVQSAQNLFEQIKLKIPELYDVFYQYLDSLTFDTAWLKGFIKDVNIEKTIEQITGGINFLIPNVTNVLTSTVNIVTTVIFSVIIAIYISLSQEDISRQSKKVILAYMKPEWASKLLKFFGLFYQSFAKFLSGQCLEAVILGAIMAIAFSIFKLPYASLVGVLTAVCAIIPYVGAFISGSISVLLAALLDPTIALKCLIVYLVVQFIENQFIYPRVVGNSVNLPAIYILLSALVGGKIFGVIGIIFMIPLVAVVVETIQKDVHKRLGEDTEDNAVKLEQS